MAICFRQLFFSMLIYEFIAEAIYEVKNKRGVS
jgi:hypothetical protein